MSTSTVPVSELETRLSLRIATNQFDLPLLPDVASRVLAICRDPDAESRQLAELIQRDPALAGHVLRIANSAAYAPRQPIVSLPQAIGRLGLSTLGNIAVAAAMSSTVFVVRGHEARTHAMRAHAASTAGWTREIARMRRRNVEAAFLAGLLHDVGMPVVLRAALDEARGTHVDDDTLERWMLAFHATAGARLLETWKLPFWMQAAIAGHHEPALARDHADLAAMLVLGDEIAEWCSAPDDAREARIRGLPVLAKLGLYSEDMDELLARRASVADLTRDFA